jgi:replicative DNA helicase
MSRNIVNRGMDAEPELSDLRESGALEQDATHVLFPRMAWGANPTQNLINEFPENRDGRIVSVPLRVYVKKNRNGSVGVTNVFKWNKSINDFEVMDDRDLLRRRARRAAPPRQTAAPANVPLPLGED